MVISSQDSHVARGFHPKSIEPLVRDVFPIGTRVETPNYFKGVVTGYEEETNRAVCYSDKTNQYTDNIDPGDADRIRYSYSVDNISVIHEVQLHVGNHYTLTTVKGNTAFVVCTYHPTDKGAVMLVAIENGSIVAIFDKTRLSRRDLMRKQITNLEDGVAYIMV
ncbi:hypothetical protein D3C75_1009790 [compost metagenome]